MFMGNWLSADVPQGGREYSMNSGLGVLQDIKQVPFPVEFFNAPGCIITIGLFCKRQESNQINFTVKETLKRIYSATLSFLLMKPWYSYLLFRNY